MVLTTKFRNVLSPLDHPREKERSDVANILFINLCFANMINYSQFLLKIAENVNTILIQNIENIFLNYISTLR